MPTIFEKFPVCGKGFFAFLSLLGTVVWKLSFLSAKFMPGKDFVSTNKNLNGSLFHAVESLVPRVKKKLRKNCCWREQNLLTCQNRRRNDDEGFAYHWVSKSFHGFHCNQYRKIRSFEAYKMQLLYFPINHTFFI